MRDPDTVDAAIPIVWTATRYSGYRTRGSFVDLAYPAVTTDHNRSIIENYDCAKNTSRQTTGISILYPSLSNACLMKNCSRTTDSASSQDQDFTARHSIKMNSGASLTPSYCKLHCLSQRFFRGPGQAKKISPRRRKYIRAYHQ